MYCFGVVVCRWGTCGGGRFESCILLINFPVILLRALHLPCSCLFFYSFYFPMSVCSLCVCFSFFFLLSLSLICSYPLQGRSLCLSLCFFLLILCVILTCCVCMFVVSVFFRSPCCFPLLVDLCDCCLCLRLLASVSCKSSVSYVTMFLASCMFLFSTSVSSVSIWFFRFHLYQVLICRWGRVSDGSSEMDGWERRGLLLSSTFVSFACFLYLCLCRFSSTWMVKYLLGLSESVFVVWRLSSAGFLYFLVYLCPSIGRFSVLFCL